LSEFYERHLIDFRMGAISILRKIPEIVKVVNMFKNHQKGICKALVEIASNAMA
jgi:hypothetical protein